VRRPVVNIERSMREPVCGLPADPKDNHQCCGYSMQRDRGAIVFRAARQVFSSLDLCTPTSRSAPIRGLTKAASASWRLLSEDSSVDADRIARRFDAAVALPVETGMAGRIRTPRGGYGAATPYRRRPTERRRSTPAE
jgi:hypothetical protein